MILQGGELRLYARGPLMCLPPATLQSRPSLSPSQIADLRLAASKMTGPQRRAFEAEMTLKYCGGNGTGSVEWGYFPLLQQELRRFECRKVHAPTPSKS